MLNGMSALTFVDNHDNQRGHGGAGAVLTYHEDYKYKIATAFSMAHHYGFKRIMSSYSFDNTDQGPPGSQPNDASQACGNGWICEHRWSSIMNLAQVTYKIECAQELPDCNICCLDIFSLPTSVPTRW
jgi:alpha-amylase